MRKSDLHPPLGGLNADPVLYGVAAGLAQLFPLIESPKPCRVQDARRPEGEKTGERREG